MTSTSDAASVAASEPHPAPADMPADPFTTEATQPTEYGTGSPAPAAVASVATPGGGRPAADRDPTGRFTTAHGPTDHGPTDHDPTDHDPTDHDPTDHDPTDRSGPGGRGPTDPRGPGGRERSGTRRTIRRSRRGASTTGPAGTTSTRSTGAASGTSSTRGTGAPASTGTPGGAGSGLGGISTLRAILRDDSGMSTVEYAIGTVAAAAFAAILYAVVSGDTILGALTGIVQRALSTTF